jgi:hypothetical protein
MSQDRVVPVYTSTMDRLFTRKDNGNKESTTPQPPIQKIGSKGPIGRFLLISVLEMVAVVVSMGATQLS